MPGGRLTQQERQQIALGLADGLAYAEIARRLDRPTSTITREVMRNGGPTAYRADLAHRATEHRAHRRRKAAPQDLDTSPQAYGRDAEAVRDYQEMFTTVFMQSGLPKMTARVLASLYTTDAGSLTASELRRGPPDRARHPSPKRSRSSRTRASSAGNATTAARALRHDQGTGGLDRRAARCGRGSPEPAAPTEADSCPVGFPPRSGTQAGWGTRRRLRPPGLGGRGSLVQGGPGRSRHSGPAPTPGHRAGDAPLNQRHPGGPCADAESPS
ncbi:hypothetical protein SALBM311S_01632 [Streptomyces alboniger]